MKDQSSGRRYATFSLRELFLLVAFVAVACAALKFAGSVWWAVLSAFAGLVFLAAAVTALLERGPRQAFAIGFIVCAGVYYGLVASASGQGPNNNSNPELDPYSGRMPTTTLLKPLLEAVVVNKWVDATGKEIPNFNPSAGGGFGAGPGAIVILMPTRQDFMRIGHCLWTLLLGYLGGHFGRFVYLRRIARQEAPVPKEDLGNEKRGTRSARE